MNDISSERLSFSNQYLRKENSHNLDLYKYEIPDKTIKYYIKKDDLIVYFTPDDTDLYPGKKHKLIFEQIVKSFRFTE